MLRFLYEKLRTAFAAPAESRPPDPDVSADPPAYGDFDPRLLAILVCPSSHEPLRHDREAGLLIADRAGLAYPLVDGIPILLASEARPAGRSRPAAGEG